MGTFIDPLTDFGFKRLFGSEPSKELLIDFLNQLFSGRKVIKDLIYNKNEQSGSVSKSRKMIFDLTCTGEQGEQFIIEVQRMRQQYFKDRAVYYTSRLIQDQPSKGGDWNYSLKEVFFIGLMDSAFEDSESPEYLHHVRLAYEKSGKEFYNKLAFIFIEIPKFTKGEKELKTGEDKWLYLLKNLSSLKQIPNMLDSRIFSKLFKIAAISNLTKEEYMNYEKDLMAAWDEYAIKQTLLEEGLQKGIQKGLQKGREEGRQKGREEAKLELIQKMLSSGKFKIAEIAELADVSEAFVRSVQKKH